MKQTQQINSIETANLAIADLTKYPGPYEKILTIYHHSTGNPDNYFCVFVAQKYNGTIVSVNTHPLRCGFQETSIVHGDINESIKSSVESLKRLVQTLS